LKTIASNQKNNGSFLTVIVLTEHCDVFALNISSDALRRRLSVLKGKFGLQSGIEPLT
jgi:hypothetical protein